MVIRLKSDDSLCNARSRVVRVAWIFLLPVLLLLTAGCVPGDGASTVDDPSGFFSGIWHGWVAPLTLIWGFFNPAIRVYEAVNTGWWYDFGYYMAVISPFGGLSLSRRRKSHDPGPSV